MEAKKVIKKAAGALATGLLIKLLLLQVATACPSALVCGNFTNTAKLQDCNYLISQGLSNQEKQEVLCILWDQEYDFPPYQNPVYPQAQANFAFSYNEIETSRFVMAGKIGLFIAFNYCLFSLLTKPSFIRKWATVA